MALPQRPCQPFISPTQVREARNLLKWSETRLAGLVEMTPRSVARFERSKLQRSSNDLQSIRDALETAGTVFMDENGKRGRVRLKDEDSKNPQRGNVAGQANLL
jgi:transcriptional regulator with XRE-family HTH domain